MNLRHFQSWRCVIALAFCVGWCCVTLAQSPEKPKEKAAQKEAAPEPPSETESPKGTAKKPPAKRRVAKPEPTPEIRLSLPEQTIDGRTLKAIGVFQSQLIDLVPRNYRPIEVERLAEAMRESEAKSNDDRVSRLASAIYDIELVNDTLRSERSAIEIESNREGIIRRRLGRVNLAVQATRDEAPLDDSIVDDEIFPRLESDAEGNLTAVFRSERASQQKEQVGFAWSLRGERSGTQREFRMQIPRTVQTRMILKTPSDVSIACENAVLRQWPGPPPGKEAAVSSSNVRWYTIDAGGLDQVVITAKPTVEPIDLPPIVVRNESRIYEISQTGINWRHTLVIESTAGTRLPAMTMPFGTVTRVDINEQSCQFISQSLDGQSNRLTIVPPLGSMAGPSVGGNAANDQRINSYTLSISGNGGLDL